MHAIQMGSRYCWLQLKRCYSTYSKIIHRGITLLFFGAVVFLLIQHARGIEWNQVFLTLKKTSLLTLLTGFLCGIVCYAAYAAYDLFARQLLKLSTPIFGTWLGAWISYAFNVNLGALIGSIAFRYRVYSKLDVESGDVTRILGIVVSSNWLGYFLLAGLLFASGFLTPPEEWAIGKVALQAIGVAFLGATFIYVGFCTFASKREYTIGKRQITLPHIKMVGLQFLIAIIHWSFMAITIYQFMPDTISFYSVYTVLLISCIAGALSHIPGGLGVLEAVFVALLSSKAPDHQLIAGVFAYRCVFYFAPLLIALTLYIGFEKHYR